MSDKVLILSCGGTFDKSKFTRSGKFVCGEPAATQLLNLGGVDSKNYEVRSVLKKDSLDMDDQDRQLVLDTVVKAKQTKIVIVHGTDTLVTTAQLLAKKVKKKTVVVVGAMRPAIFTGSDAAFNLGYALAHAQVAKNGVWVAMHGKIWAANKVTKDTKKYRFVDK